MPNHDEKLHGSKPVNESVLAVELVETGSDLVGAVTGAAIGLIGGPAGAFGGAIAGVGAARAVKHIGSEIRRRVLAPREEARVGGTLALIIVSIGDELQNGRVPRSDGFFEAHGEDRAVAEELLEGVLLRARDAYEEKKVPLLGALYTSIAFDDRISPAHGNLLLQLASSLTYQQLVAMSVMLDSSQVFRLRQSPYRGDQEALERLGFDGRALMTEIYDLFQRGLIADSSNDVWISVADVNPSTMRLQGSGAVLAYAMKLLETVGAGDREVVYGLLGQKESSREISSDRH
jgi:hypothetical protein